MSKINRKPLEITGETPEELFEQFKQVLKTANNEIVFGFVNLEKHAIIGVDYARHKGFKASYIRQNGKFKVSVVIV